MLITAESHPDVPVTFAVAAAGTGVFLPLVQQGPMTLLLFACLTLFFTVGALFARGRQTLRRVGRPEVVFGLILASGLLCRLRALLTARSLWFDEVSLALSIHDRSLTDLLTTPLPFYQSAPPGFLTATWFGAELLGIDLVFARTIPFIAGVLTLGFGLLVARSALKTLPAQAFFLAILAWSPVLIFYSSELKQYSTDVLAMTVGLYVAHLLKEHRVTLAPALLGFVAVLTSSAGLIVFFLLAMIVIVSGYAEQRFWGVIAVIRRNIAALMSWFLAATIHVIYTAVAGVNRAYMQQYWGDRGGFAPQTVASLNDVLWYPDRVNELVWLTFHANEMVGPGMHSVILFTLLPAVVLILTGMRSMSTNNWPLLLVAASGLTAFALAQLHAYPFSSRLALYLIPALSLLMACGIDRYEKRARCFGLPVPTMLIGALLAIGLIASAFQQFSSPYVGKDMDGALRLIAREWQDGDAVWAVPLDLPMVDWHRDSAGFTMPVTVVDATAVSPSHAVTTLEQSVPSRLWIVSSARRREARTLYEEALPFYRSTTVYSRNDTYIALLSNVGTVEFDVSDDRALARLRYSLSVG